LSSEVFLSSLPSLAVALKWSIFVIITLNFQVGTVLGISHQNSWLKIFHLSYFFHPIWKLSYYSNFTMCPFLLSSWNIFWLPSVFDGSIHAKFLHFDWHEIAVVSENIHSH
jgi:hypothetical protein